MAYDKTKRKKGHISMCAAWFAAGYRKIPNLVHHMSAQCQIFYRNRLTVVDSFGIGVAGAVQAPV